MTSADGDYELDLDELEASSGNEESTDGEKELENVFGVGEDESTGGIVLRRKVPARITREQAHNLAAWIIAATEADVHDIEELARRAVESL